VFGATAFLNQALLRLLAGLQSLGRSPQDERGQTLAEYGLLLALIAVVVVVGAVVAFRAAIVEAWNALPHCLA
jgi:Flp pilus assembly pilin Flp